MDIKLIVVRTPDIKVLADFYSNFGLTFDYHKHGNSPYHYSATLGQTVLEIYPLTKSQTGPDKNLRLGISVDNFDDVINKLKDLGVALDAKGNGEFYQTFIPKDMDKKNGL